MTNSIVPSIGQAAAAELNGDIPEAFAKLQDQDSCVIWGIAKRIRDGVPSVVVDYQTPDDLLHMSFIYEGCPNLPPHVVTALFELSLPTIDS